MWRIERARKLLSGIHFDAKGRKFSTQGKQRVKKQVKGKDGKTFMQTFWVKGLAEASPKVDPMSARESISVLLPKKEKNRTKFTYSKEVQKAIDIGYSIMGEHKDELDAAVALYEETKERLDIEDERMRIDEIEKMLVDMKKGKKRNELTKEKKRILTSIKSKVMEASHDPDMEIEKMGEEACSKLRKSLIQNSKVSRDQMLGILNNQYTIQIGPGAYELEKEEGAQSLYQEMADFIRIVEGRGVKDEMTFKIGHPTEEEIKAGLTRSYASPYGGLVRIMTPRLDVTNVEDKSVISNALKESLWHEMGHHVEFAIEEEYEEEKWVFPEEDIPFPHNLGQMIVKDRAEGDLRSLSEISPRYGSDEKYYPDKWIDPYCGKSYLGESTEVVSMGLQYFADEKKMFELYRKDPDHFAFTLGFARGNAHRREKDYPYGFDRKKKR